MTDLPHGHSRYQKGCRCDVCRAAKRLYQKRWTLERHRTGTGRLATAEETDRARQRIATLRAAGMSVRAIARHAGLPEHRIWSITSGDTTRARRTTLTHINAVRLDTTTTGRQTGGVIDATGTRRRVQALAHHGWTIAAIAREADVSPARLGEIRRGKPTTTPAVHNRVAAATTRLDGVDAPDDCHATRARNEAARSGWPRLADWDDIDLDTDPVDTDTVQGVDVEDVRHLLAAGVSTHEVAERLGRPWPRVQDALDASGDAVLARIGAARREADVEAVRRAAHTRAHKRSAA